MRSADRICHEGHLRNGTQGELQNCGPCNIRQDVRAARRKGEGCLEIPRGWGALRAGTGEAGGASQKRQIMQEAERSTSLEFGSKVQQGQMFQPPADGEDWSTRLNKVAQERREHRAGESSGLRMAPPEPLEPLEPPTRKVIQKRVVLCKAGEESVSRRKM